MLYKTHGIVFNFIKYKESSIIVRIYTQEFGLQSYIVNSIRSQKSKGRIALFQPFTLLDLVVYHNPTKNIQRIAEYKCLKSYQSIPFDIRKTTITMYLSEVFYRSIKTETKENGLFDFMKNALIQFDEMENSFENFHIRILYDLTYYLGIQPENVKELADEMKHSLDFKQTDRLTNDEIISFEVFLNSDYSTPINAILRKKYLYALNDYYRLHIDNFGTIQSLKILNEVFQ